MSGNYYLNPSVRRLRLLRDEHNKQRVRVTIGKNNVTTWIWSSFYTLNQICPEMLTGHAEAVARLAVTETTMRAKQLLEGVRTLKTILDERYKLGTLNSGECPI